VPLNDPMTLVNNNQSAAKTNLYRAGVDQPQIGAGADSGDGATYCTNLFNDPRGIRRVFAGQTIFAAGPSPDQATGTSLFTFLAARANESFDNLGLRPARTEERNSHDPCAWKAGEYSVRRRDPSASMCGST
jgi:hypothetical protein